MDNQTPFNLEEMLAYLNCVEDKVGTCNCENPFEVTMVEGECTKAMQAIRAALTDYFRLRDRIKDWREQIKDYHLFEPTLPALVLALLGEIIDFDLGREEGK